MWYKTQSANPRHTNDKRITKRSVRSIRISTESIFHFAKSKWQNETQKKKKKTIFRREEKRIIYLGGLTSSLQCPRAKLQRLIPRHRTRKYCNKKTLRRSSCCCLSIDITRTVKRWNFPPIHSNLFVLRRNGEKKEEYKIKFASQIIYKKCWTKCVENGIWYWRRSCNGESTVISASLSSRMVFVILLSIFLKFRRE